MSTRALLARFLRPREFDQVFAHDQAGKEVVDFLVERAELGHGGMGRVGEIGVKCWEEAEGSEIEIGGEGTAEAVDGAFIESIASGVGNRLLEFE